MPLVMREGRLGKAQAPGPTLLTGEPAKAGSTSVAQRSLAKGQAHRRHPVMASEKGPVGPPPVDAAQMHWSTGAKASGVFTKPGILNFKINKQHL